jgi:hypothetical protein
MGNRTPALAADEGAACRALVRDADVADLVARFRALARSGAAAPAEWVAVSRLLEGMLDRADAHRCGVGVRNAAAALQAELRAAMVARLDAAAAVRPGAPAAAPLFGSGKRGRPGAAPDAGREALAGVWRDAPRAPLLGPWTPEFQACLARPHLRALLRALGRDPAQGRSFRAERRGPCAGAPPPARGAAAALVPVPVSHGEREIAVRADRRPADAEVVAVGDFAVTAGALRALGAATRVVIDDPNGTIALYLFRPRFVSHHAFRSLRSRPPPPPHRMCRCVGA